jgi:hypothetical protein
MQQRPISWSRGVVAAGLFVAVALFLSIRDPINQELRDGVGFFFLVGAGAIGIADLIAQHRRSGSVSLLALSSVSLSIVGAFVVGFDATAHAFDEHSALAASGVFLLGCVPALLLATVIYWQAGSTDSHGNQAAGDHEDANGAHGDKAKRQG